MSSDKPSTWRELASATGKSLPTIYRWKKWGLEELRQFDDTFDVEEVLQWAKKIKRKNLNKNRQKMDFQARELDEPAKKQNEDFDNELEEEAKWSNEYRKYKAIKERIGVEKLQGQLVDRTEMETLFADRAREVKKQLLSLGKRLAPRLEGLPPREIETEITKETTRICLNYSRDINL